MPAEISVIVPVYDEADNVAPLVREVAAVVITAVVCLLAIWQEVTR